MEGNVIDFSGIRGAKGYSEDTVRQIYDSMKRRGADDRLVSQAIAYAINERDSDPYNISGGIGLFKFDPKDYRINTIMDENPARETERQVDFLLRSGYSESMFGDILNATSMDVYDRIQDSHYHDEAAPEGGFINSIVDFMSEEDNDSHVDGRWYPVEGEDGISHVGGTIPVGSDTYVDRQLRRHGSVSDDEFRNAMNRQFGDVNEFSEGGSLPGVISDIVSRIHAKQNGSNSFACGGKKLAEGGPANPNAIRDGDPNQNDPNVYTVGTITPNTLWQSNTHSEGGNLLRRGGKKNEAQKSTALKDYTTTIEDMTTSEAAERNRGTDGAYMYRVNDGIGDKYRNYYDQHTYSDDDSFLYPEELIPSVLYADRPTLSQYNYARGQKAGESVAKGRDRTAPYVGIATAAGPVIAEGAPYAWTLLKDFGKTALSMLDPRTYGQLAAKLFPKYAAGLTLAGETAGVALDSYYGADMLEDAYDVAYPYITGNNKGDVADGIGDAVRVGIDLIGALPAVNAIRDYKNIDGMLHGTSIENNAVNKMTKKKKSSDGSGDFGIANGSFDDALNRSNLSEKEYMQLLGDVPEYDPNYQDSYEFLKSNGFNPSSKNMENGFEIMKERTPEPFKVFYDEKYIEKEKLNPHKYTSKHVGTGESYDVIYESNNMKNGTPIGILDFTKSVGNPRDAIVRIPKVDDATMDKVRANYNSLRAHEYDHATGIPSDDVGDNIKMALGLYSPDHTKKIADKIRDAFNEDGYSMLHYFTKGNSSEVSARITQVLNYIGATSKSVKVVDGKTLKAGFEAYPGIDNNMRMLYGIIDGSNAWDELAKLVRDRKIAKSIAPIAAAGAGLSAMKESE